MTTLELAEKVARAVLKEVDQGEMALLPHDEYFSEGPYMTNAVLDVLRENDSWFCRMPTGPDGEQREEDIRPYEQQPLF